MPPDAEFMPDDFWIEQEGLEQVRLVWERTTGECKTVLLARTQVPAVLRELERQIEFECPASVEFLSHLANTVAKVTALRFAPQADHFRMTAFVELLKVERGLEFSLRFSEGDVDRCVSAMTQWLEEQRGDR
jgi:hypothetical protein